jgi:signal transduction histidine kinase
MIGLNAIKKVVLVAAILPLVFAGTVFAASDVEIKFKVSELDACPNIPGHQSAIPDGMEIDANGNCYTPTAEPPEVVDLCVNIDGVQAVLPDNYYRTPEGDCFPQLLPPVDVCPNLPDTQEAVPDGYFLDPESNFCFPVIVPEPPDTSDEDVCRNIPGVQTTTPEGMKNDNGYCYTPSPHIAPPLPNVPGFLQPVARFFVGLVPEGVRDFFRDLPDEVVHEIPLWILVMALIFVLIPIPQSIREYLYKRKLIAFYKREQAIAEEKDNFITLASHYLRTPLTIMKDSIPMMIGAGDITPATASAMAISLEAFGNQITKQLDMAEASPELQDLGAAPKAKPFYRSGFFWLPIILSILLTVLVNFFIGVVGEKAIGLGNALLQLIIVVAFIVVLYLLVRNYHIQKRLRQERDEMIRREQVIDKIRNDFINQQTGNISTALSALYTTSLLAVGSQYYNLYTNGLGRLSSIHDKFMLLSQIKTGASRSTSKFDVRATVDRAIGTELSRIADKSLVVQNAVGSAMIVQNEPLFSFVVSSILDNAIKFTGPGGRIYIASHPKKKTITVRVSDNGRGIDPEKLDQLFKPFSRAESAVEFSYEGLGLSLFLTRLILTYTGGSIGIEARQNGGTDVSITTPVDISQII